MTEIYPVSVNAMSALVGALKVGFDPVRSSQGNFHPQEGRNASLNSSTLT